MNFKSKNVLFCGEVSQSSDAIIKVLLGQNIKSLQIANPNESSIAQMGLADSRLSHYVGNLTKIDDLEVIYTETLKRTKNKIHVIVNHKELNANDEWENVITTHINSIICSTLMAIKHLGSMNGGEGGTVVNTIVVCSRSDDEYASIYRLLNDLDRSFSDPYYFNNTAVRILTMCTRMEMGEGSTTLVAGPSTEAYSMSATEVNLTGADVSTLAKNFLDVFANKRSCLDPAEKLVEQFEISVQS